MIRVSKKVKAYLAANYGIRPTREIAEKLGFKVDRVHYMARRAGLKNMSFRSAFIRNYIKVRLNEVSSDILAVSLGITTRYVDRIIQEMNLVKPDGDDNYLADEVRELLLNVHLTEQRSVYRKWTELELAYLKYHYPRKEISPIAKFLKRNERDLVKTARYYKIKHKRIVRCIPPGL